MNPFRVSSEPDVDKTEVAKAKIHEAAETERTKIREREETKRKEMTMKGDAWVYPWVVCGVVVFATIVGAGMSFSNYLESKGPKDGCIESAEVVTSSTNRRSCPGGGTMTTEVIPNRAEVIVRCSCPKETPMVKPQPP